MELEQDRLPLQVNYSALLHGEEARSGCWFPLLSLAERHCGVFHAGFPRPRFPRRLGIITERIVRTDCGIATHPYRRSWV